MCILLEVWLAGAVFEAVMYVLQHSPSLSQGRTGLWGKWPICGLSVSVSFRPFNCALIEDSCSLEVCLALGEAAKLLVTF